MGRTKRLRHGEDEGRKLDMGSSALHQKAVRHLDVDYLPQEAKSSSNKVCALVENRARETCIAVIDTMHSSVLQLSCMQDSHSYNKTLSALHALNADEILLHDGTRGRVLSSKVVNTFHEDASRVLFVSRQYFDQDEGAELLKRLASGPINADMMSKYTALAASHCLIRYIENATGFAFADSSLRIRTDTGVDAIMSIGRSTAKELELIADTRSGGQKKSLFGVVNQTRTTVGARLLRSMILGPCTDIPTIHERLDLVTFFLGAEGVFTNTLKILRELKDLDRMLSDLVIVPRQVTPVTAGRSIAMLICLRHTLRLMAPLAEALEDGMRESAQQLPGGSTDHAREGLSSSSREFDHRRNGPSDGTALLKTMVEIFCDPCLKKILERLDEVLTESTSYSRNPAMMRHQECFAVRPDVDGMLDVARKTFLQTMEDIYETADAMSTESGYQVKVVCSTSRGYHLVIPAGVDNLPDGMVQAVRHVKTISCTTEEVASLSDRASEAVRTALLITHDIVQMLAEEVRTSGLDTLFAVTESVALLDVLFGFADLVTLSPLPFCRPEVVADGPMSIQGGRHPIVGAVQDCKFVPNDIYMSPFMNFRVVTGPNNSGKSTYLKQAGLIVLMAQMGSYVPADVAIIPVRDHLLSRIGTGDDMENNVSTFLLEMREAAHVLERVTSRSLVLIDELGRGTSNSEGLAVAWAVAEELLHSNAYTLFVTHYDQIPDLADLYPNVKNINLRTAMSNVRDEDEAPRALRYLHKAVEGRGDLNCGYGVRIAEMCGLPWEVIEEAQALRTQVLDSARKKAIGGSMGAASSGERKAYELLRTLVSLCEDGQAVLKGTTLERSALREFLYALSLEYKGANAAEILSALEMVSAASSDEPFAAHPRSNGDSHRAINATMPCGEADVADTARGIASTTPTAGDPASSPERPRILEATQRAAETINNGHVPTAGDKRDATDEGATSSTPAGEEAGSWL